jgi:hypothetical protein
VMFIVALFWFLRQQKITLWECLGPRWDDVPPLFMPAGLRTEFYNYKRRTQSALGTRRSRVGVVVGAQTRKVLINGIEWQRPPHALASEGNIKKVS